MRFDTIIIGSGLAGVICGIKLAQSGRYCALVSAGQSAMHFSSGSLDFLNALPDGTPVKNPAVALEALIKQSSRHPYAIIGKNKTLQLAEEAAELLYSCGIRLRGSLAENHLRVTPFGMLHPAWLSAEEIPQLDWPDENARILHLPWKKAALINIEGFIDFYPEFLEHGLQELGLETCHDYVSLPCLNALRRNPSEFRSTNIARVLEKPVAFEELTLELSRIKGADCIFFPACLGIDGNTQVRVLEEKLGVQVRLLPTLPPSLIGSRMNQILLKRFQGLGGVYMPGDTVLRALVRDGLVEAVYTRNHAEMPLRLNSVVLAAGSFFNRGLVSVPDEIKEPVFGLDLFCGKERKEWSAQELFGSQPYMTYGVETDDRLRGMINGKAIANLYCAGMILPRFDPVSEGCGAGVSLASAMFVAEDILRLPEQDAPEEEQSAFLHCGSGKMETPI